MLNELQMILPFLGILAIVWYYACLSLKEMMTYKDEKEARNNKGR